MQILVVVANIQMRTLKTEVGKGSARTAIGRGLVGPKAKANADKHGYFPRYPLPKGKVVNIPLPAIRIERQRRNEPEDIGMCHWKSSLFFLTGHDHGTGLSRDLVVRQAEQSTLRAVSCTHDDH